MQGNRHELRKINNLDVELEGPGSHFAAAYINGSSGSDDIRFSNIDFRAYSEWGHYFDFFVDTLPWAANSPGGDQIVLTNVDISMETPGELILGAQLFTSFAAETVSMNNVTLQGGEAGGSGNILGVSGRNIDLRNVSVTSNEGWTGIYLSSIGFAGGPVDQDATINLNNVTVAAGPNFQDAFQCYITTEGGNDVVTIRNSSLDNLFVDLGAGNDSLALFDCSIISALLYGGDGNDRLKMRNNYGLIDFFDFEIV